MANAEHLAKLKEGVEAWNEWRKENWRIVPDLKEAKLDGMHLHSADFARADLSNASLHKADLSHAHLGFANLFGADFANAALFGAKLDLANCSYANFNNARLDAAFFNNANLSDSVLMYAILNGTVLMDANLCGANCGSADFNGTHVAGADFSGASFSATRMARVDLSAAKNLELVEHAFPSSIDFDTLYRSKGRIPEVFLRGAGVPEDLIKYIPSLVGAGIGFYSCFISYSSRDEEFARRLHARMQQEKLRVWFAPEDMKGGKKFLDQIDEAIRLHDKLLLVLSEESIQSNWVMQEIRRARKREKKEARQTFFPIRLTDIKTLQEWECVDPDSGEDLALEVRKYHLPDFTNWKEHDAFEVAFKKLLADLRKSERGEKGG